MSKVLNIGSGTHPMAGCDNCDVNADLPNLTFVCEMDKIPVEDNTYDELVSIHSLEHVPFPKARLALKEWYRILKTDGQVSIETPNIRRNVALYLNGGWERDFAALTEGEREMCSLNGTPNKTLWVNFKMFSSPAQWDIHFGNYDAELLVAFCSEAGFSVATAVQEEPTLIVRATKQNLSFRDTV